LDIGQATLPLLRSARMDDGVIEFKRSQRRCTRTVQPLRPGIGVPILPVVTIVRRRPERFPKNMDKTTPPQIP